MAKTQNKTTANRANVTAFLKSIEHDRRREDCRTIVELMQDITGEKPVMWGSSIIGFGSYHYVYDSGREGDMFITGVSPRKQNLVLYIVGGFSSYEKLLEQLGKHRTGKACLYINKLDDIHLPTLRKLITRSVAALRKKYPL